MVYTISNRAPSTSSDISPFDLYNNIIKYKNQDKILVLDMFDIKYEM